jgi:DNA polymerase-4
MSPRRYIAHLHLHAEPDEEQLADILELLSGVTPRLQAFPPDAVQLDLTSALRYFGKDPGELVQMARMRLTAMYGIETSAGLAGNRMLAAMAAAASPPGGTTRVPADRAGVEAWLYPRPVAALPGVGRATATALGRYGLHTVGQVAATPAATLQRILGAAPARMLAERARGHDPRPVTSTTPAAHMTADLVLDRDCLDPAQHHRAVLGLAEQLGLRLRAEQQAAGRLTLTVRYADRTATTRTRTLPGPTDHSPVVIAAALGILASLGLERARVRAYALRLDDLRPAAQTPRQLTMDPADERARAAESAGDRARRRFGPAAAHPATLAGPREDRPRGDGPRPDRS